MRYDVILWDVDGTLLDFSYSQRLCLSRCLEEIGEEPTEEIVERYAAINESWWQRLERGEVSKKQLLTGRFLDLFAEFGIGCEDVETFQSHYEQYLGDVYQCTENALETCRYLKGKCRQCVVTNGLAATALNKLKLSGFYQLMDDIFISEQLGVPKPQRAFFDRVFETMPEINRERVLIVGDSLSSDMRGGNNAGIVTCWYNPRDEINTTAVETNFIIRNLKEVIQIMEG